MKTLAALCLTAAVIFSSPAAAQLSLKWEDDFNVALKRAKAEKKQVFLDVWAEWCGPCMFMKEKIFPTPKAMESLNSYIPTALMIQNRQRVPNPANMAVADKYKVEGLPTLLILDENGKELKRFVGAFQTPEALAAWLKGK